jgi:xanthine dehydrogenase accessory factor
MTMKAKNDVMDIASDLKLKGKRFALATVVRTVSVTAAKAGAKAIILPDGTVEGGWIGGGCAKSAVLKTAQLVLEDGTPRLVSIAPADMLAEQGVQPGAEIHGQRFAKNMCPSQGTMDIFVEPVMPIPSVVICGSSPVAVALAKLSQSMGYAVTVCAPQPEQGAFAEADSRVEGYALAVNDPADRFIVVSTQGKGDEAALRAILGVEAPYKAFVGSRKKMASIREKLIREGAAPEQIDAVKAPAGLDIGAIAPEEIALSILSEITAVRRKAARP